jgi:hypothetical protein
MDNQRDRDRVHWSTMPCSSTATPTRRLRSMSDERIIGGKIDVETTFETFLYRKEKKSKILNTCLTRGIWPFELPAHALWIDGGTVQA